MKKLISTLMITGVLASSFTGFAFCDESIKAVPTLISYDKTVAVPTLYDNTDEIPTLYDNTTDIKFEVKQEGDKFTIILEENPSTGYAWTHTVADKNLVEYVSDKALEADTELVGAPGKHEFTFIAKTKGVSTITFNYKRSWETEEGEKLDILVYKTDDKLIVEQDSVVYAMDKAVPTLYSDKKVYFNDEIVDTTVKAQLVDGVMMLPLRSTLEKMGFEVKWKEETQSVEISKGAQWTSVKIGSNSYFKNKMAPSELSSAPVIVDGSAMIPAEFISAILGRSIMVEEGNIKISDEEAVIHSGYVKDIAFDETGSMTITISSDKDSEDMMYQTIIHTSSAYTYYNKKVVKGEFINVVSSMVMTMSIPGQTSGYIVY